MAIDKSLVSGSTSMLILRLLEEKDMYGYEMIEELRRKSENVFELKAGTLYPCEGAGEHGGQDGDAGFMGNPFLGEILKRQGQSRNC